MFQNASTVQLPSLHFKGRVMEGAESVEVGCVGHGVEYDVIVFIDGELGACLYNRSNFRVVAFHCVNFHAPNEVA